MKLNSVNNKKESKKREAFTLIEMIGVLAVIAILAAMLIPRVFEAINNARVNNAAVTCETLKAAAADHYGKYGKLDYLFGTNGLTAPITNYDTAVLMREGLLDKPFSVKIGGGDPSTNCVLQLVAGGQENGGRGYQLDGTLNTMTTNAQFVLEAVIYGVSAADAKDLNDRIDGGTLSAPLAALDAKGRVEYQAIVGSGTVYVYLTHR
jgi:prepilin-type N-terminal cleavage/methylation domain-containing protein